MRRAAPWILVLLSMAALLAVTRLFQMRFAAGDVYPVYSSMRSDPLGTKGLYESLENLPSLEVTRHFRSIHRLPAGRNTTLLILGLPARELNGSNEEIQALESFMRLGGRLVISLNSESLTLQSARSKGTNAVPPADKSVGGSARLIELDDRWQFKLQKEALSREGANLKQIESVAANPGQKPDRLVWHSSGFFVRPEAPWRAVYRRGTNAVVMERSWGSGTLVLATDTFPLSNEALRHQRSSAWLSWVVGPSRKVVFDETHLGVREQLGFAALAREYRLQLFAGCLAVLAGLFIWRGATSFAPPTADLKERGDRIIGRDAADGFVSLLRRHVEPQELLELCLQEWKRSRHGGRSLSSARLKAVQAVVDRENAKQSAQKDPVSAYQEIARVVSPSTQRLVEKTTLS